MHGFGGREVGVVGDAALFVCGDGLAFHDPFDGGLAVDDVVVAFQRDVADGDVLVVDDRGFVFDALLRFRVFDVGELHFADVEVFGHENTDRSSKGVGHSKSGRKRCQEPNWCFRQAFVAVLWA